MQKISIFWFRRDLRLEDNTALFHALNSNYPVLPLFIFDEEIIAELDKDDARISFIYEQLKAINQTLNEKGSGIYCLKGKPASVWQQLLSEFNIQEVFANGDYEPYALQRDESIVQFLSEKKINFHSFRDQVIFEKDEVVKADGLPYTIYTPYKNKWLEHLSNEMQRLNPFKCDSDNFVKIQPAFPTLKEIGFENSSIKVLPYSLSQLENYSETRNFPAMNQTSYLSPHLRFGTVSIRSIASKLLNNEVFLSELIWREFFMQILYHFPKVVHSNFKSTYDGIQWRNNENEFEKWKTGTTGYPIVDAGMRELNATGYMHNRVRMITAGFLCKHLLIDWRWGEAYFAKKLLDYELSANNGNWQWSAGTGCDAAPYFRVFNPTEQVKKFDPKLEYIKKWIPELETFNYPTPMVEHKFARDRAIATYKKGLE